MFPYVYWQQVQLKDSTKLTETSTLLSNLAGKVLFFFIPASLPSDSCVLIRCLVFQVGNAGECPPSSRLADAAGEEASLYAASCQLQAFPHNGYQSKG